MEVFFNQISILAVLVVIGVGASKLNIINVQAKDLLARIIFNITLPLLIFTGVSNMELTPSLATNSLAALVFSALMIGLMWGIGAVSSRLLKLPPATGSVHTVHTMFGNIIYLGFPLINALFPGGDGLYYAMLLHLVSSFIMWTLGVHLLQSENRTGFFAGLKHLANPNTFAFVLGFLMLAFSIKLPVILKASLGGLGDTTIYLSMLYIGAILAGIKWKEALTSFQAYILSFNKLVTVPLTGLFLVLVPLKLLSFSPGNLAYSVILLELAMPCMANIVVLAKIYGADDTMAAKNVFISTVLSIITLPFVYYLLTAYLPL